MRASPCINDVDVDSTAVSPSLDMDCENENVDLEVHPFAVPAPSDTPCTAEEEKRRVLETEGATRALQAGKHYYLINKKWQTEWLRWVGHPSARGSGSSEPPRMGAAAGRERSSASGSLKERPGPIDNRGLLDPAEPGKLKRDLCENRDYEILSEEVWGLLHGWYQGGPPIKRRAITQSSGGVVVELYGLTLKVYKSTDLSSGPTTMIESKMASVEEFKRRACEEFGLSYGKTRVWDYFNRRKYANLEESLCKSLDDCRIYEDNDILLEAQLADGTWPVEEQERSPVMGPLYYNSSRRTEYSSADVATTGRPPQVGATGLQNLGNTCFMNSSIQCLANVPDLRAYFLSEEYKGELNSSAFKTKGKLAESYAQLLTKLWDPSTVQVAPRNFKWQIGQFAEQFSGYGQQDSMEFIEYVLDGLKEDVNRVQGQKPFVELREADGREDEEVASEAHANYVKRNNSRIDELFVGFFKSTVTCPEAGCGRTSVTFDPYLSVKLSLVSAQEDRCQSFSVLVVPRPPAAPRREKVSVEKFGDASSIVAEAAKKAGLDSEKCILTEVVYTKIYKFFEATDAVEQIGSNDNLVLYELEDAADFKLPANQRYRWSASTSYVHTGNRGGSSSSARDDDAAEGKRGVVIHNSCTKNSSSYSRGSMQLMGIPFLSCMDRRTSGRDLIAAVRDELEARFGESGEGNWRLCRTPEGGRLLNHHDTETVLDDDKPLQLDPRQYLVVHWNDNAEIPETLVKFAEESTNDSSASKRRSNPQSQSVQLQQCFQMFTETDKLSEMDTWYCNRCQEHREAFKKMEFWTLPPILVLQLKRFTYNAYSRDRLDTAVNFPLEGLDLSTYCLSSAGGDDSVYDLLAVSKHMGGLGGGHYVAYARSSENGRWYYFNDSSVSEVTPERVAEDQVGAYVLFYGRRDRRPESWGPPEP